MFPNHLNFYFNYKISGDTSGILMNVPAFAFVYWSQRQSEQPALQGQSQ
jgi:hypothetical protein